MSSGTGHLGYLGVYSYALMMSLRVRDTADTPSLLAPSGTIAYWRPALRHPGRVAHRRACLILRRLAALYQPFLVVSKSLCSGLPEVCVRLCVRTCVSLWLYSGLGIRCGTGWARLTGSGWSGWRRLSTPSSPSTATR
jgi:hypothetical protein